MKPDCHTPLQKQAPSLAGVANLRFQLPFIFILIAATLLASAVLGAGTARAGEVELFSVNFYPQLRNVSNPNNPNRPNRHWVGVFSDETFTFDGVTYTVNQVRQGGLQVLINITPKFPPDGQVRSKFDLEVGTTNSGFTAYLKTATFNFNDAAISSGDNAWSGGAGWGERVGGRIYITGPATPNNKLRFAGFPFTAGDNADDFGRLEMFDATVGDNGQWKWICDDGFDEEEAQVACRDMGKETSGAAVWNIPSWWLDANAWAPNVRLPAAMAIAVLWSTPALLDDLDCDGDESSLLDCDHAGRGTSDCTLSEAVGVICP